MAQKLASRGYCCHSVSNLSAASDQLAAHNYDIVLTEYLIGDQDASALLRALNKPPFGTNRDVKIVVMSEGTYAMPKDFILNMARKLGADAVLAKPFSEEELFAAIAKASGLET